MFMNQFSSELSECRNTRASTRSFTPVVRLFERERMIEKWNIQTEMTFHEKSFPQSVFVILRKNSPTTELDIQCVRFLEIVINGNWSCYIIISVHSILKDDIKRVEHLNTSSPQGRTSINAHADPRITRSHITCCARRAIKHTISVLVSFPTNRGAQGCSQIVTHNSVLQFRPVPVISVTWTFGKWTLNTNGINRQ